MTKYSLNEFEVGINGTHGYFEWVGGTNEDPECAGSLTFDGKELVDYDGVFALPGEVIQLLENAGFIVGDDFK